MSLRSSSLSAFGVKVEKREKYFIFLIIYIKTRRIKKIPKFRLLLDEPTIMSLRKSCNEIMSQKFLAILC